MDEELQQPDMHEPSPSQGDLLDEPAVPSLRLSAVMVLVIFVGGALGTVARYLFAVHHPVAQGHFPWVTLVVNLSGSLAIGVLVPLTEHIAQRAPLARPLLVIGFLGGWTTYSTLTVEAALLAKDGDVVICLAYLAATIVGGLTLVVMGHALGRKMVPA
jgi:fluoride exporter